MGKNGTYLLFSTLTVLISCQNPGKDLELEHAVTSVKTNSVVNNERQHPFFFVPREKLKGEDILDYDFTQINTFTIDSVLKLLYVLDQEYRIEIVNARKQGEPVRAIGNKMKRADSLNYHILSRIVEQIGWPDARTYSDTAMSAPFFVLLHIQATGDAIEKFFPPLVDAFMKGKIKPDYYAVLVDKICLSMALNQKFGTHCRYVKEGLVYRYNMDETSIVQKNRREIGLDSLTQNWCDLAKY